MSACKGLRRGGVRPSLSSVRCTACPAGLRLQASSLGPFAGWARPGSCARVGAACLLRCLPPGLLLLACLPFRGPLVAPFVSSKNFHKVSVSLLEPQVSGFRGIGHLVLVSDPFPSPFLLKFGLPVL